MMSFMDWSAHIVLDPEICHGRPTFRGTRVLVSVVLAYMASGHSTVEVLEDFPSVTEQSIHAALAYAAETVARDRIVTQA